MNSKIEEKEDPGTQRRRILLADDGIVDQKITSRFLSMSGHDVVVVDNGLKAVAAVEREAFDLVLMDVLMPELNGLEATAAIRTAEKGTGRHIPIIAMTSSAEDGDRERCLQAGMDEYVAKPIGPQELGQIINTVPGLVFVENQQNTGHAGPAEQSVTDETKSESNDRLIDWESALLRMPGNEDFARELAETLATELPKLIATLSTGLQENVPQIVNRAAHTLKGSAAIFHAATVVDAAAHVESLAKTGDPEALKKPAAHLLFLAEKLNKELTEILMTNER